MYLPGKGCGSSAPGALSAPVWGGMHHIGACFVLDVSWKADKSLI
jgi:hypothetical protein